MRKVTVIQRIVPHYRVPFFTRLHDELEARGIELQLIYGQERPGTVPKTVHMVDPWALQIKNQYIHMPGSWALVQPCLHYLRGSDLVITEQASSGILNYWLQFRRALGGTPMAFWGQGISVRAKNPRSFPERVKAFLIKNVDWWFAYTEHTLCILEKAGFPSDRITVVENAVENDDFKKGMESVTDADSRRLREEMGIEGENVGLYCGGFIPPKRIDFLLEVCLALKKKMPDFHAILIGSGPEQKKVEMAASEHKWIHYVGPQFAGDRAPYFRLSRVLLQPGTVGLVSVDSFVAEVPLFTTDMDSHGPEITFIKHNVNGYITPNCLQAYVSDVCAYLASPEQQNRLIQGCRESAPHYTIDNMARNFAQGVERCLAAHKEKA